MTGADGTLAAGLLLLCLAGLTGLNRRPETEHGPRAAGGLWAALPYLLGAAGSVCLAITGGTALAGHASGLNLGDLLGFAGAGGGGLLGSLADTTLAADRLSGLFLLIAFGAAVPVSLGFASWAVGRYGTARRGLGAIYALTLGAIAVIMTAGNAFVLVFGWEALTVAFYLLAGFERRRAGRPAGALVTLVFGKISGASLLAGLLLLASRSGSMTLASFAQVPPGAARSAGYVLLVIAFAVKAGLVPVQVWLPRGYAAAPGPARAVMAGVGSTVGFYGLWRTLGLLGAPPGWLAGLLLVAAGLTAILGIAHAAVATRLPRVVAYSSVENTGLIVAGFGVALTGAVIREPRLVAVGLIAATLQVVTHTAAKSLLMLAGAGIESAMGTGELDGLRGSGRRVPWSGTGFAVGALTLAGLPPTAGFVSEWFLLESLMQQFRVPGLGFRLVLAVAGAAVALTAGFAGVAFVRMVGLVVLGPPLERVKPGPDYGMTGRAGIVILAACCLSIAALTPLEIRVIGKGLATLVPAAVSAGALRSPWVVQPVYPGFSILSPSWLWITMPALLALVAALAWLASGRRLIRVRRVPAWRSATAGVEGTDSYTAFGFANPARRVLASVLLTRSELRHLEEPVDTGGEPGAPAIPHLGYLSDVVELVEEYLYRPVMRPVLWLVRVVKRLQSGRLDAYLGYMLIALVAVVAVVAALS
jgi:formate hydrogenlyase subunit 3/multisubunit Na+/H+ antiporter MnhD subunit